MPWANDAAARRHTAATYNTPEYRRNRAIARRRANGRCEGCHHQHNRLEADHITGIRQGGTHHHDNLQMLCKGPGTCRCHERKTAKESGPGPGRTPADPQPLQRTQW